MLKRNSPCSISERTFPSNYTQPHRNADLYQKCINPPKRNAVLYQKLTKPPTTCHSVSKMNQAPNEMLFCLIYFKISSSSCCKIHDLIALHYGGFKHFSNCLLRNPGRNDPIWRLRIWVFPKIMGVPPKWMVKIRDPTLWTNGWFRGKNPLFLEISISLRPKHSNGLRLWSFSFSGAQFKSSYFQGIWGEQKPPYFWANGL